LPKKLRGDASAKELMTEELPVAPIVKNAQQGAAAAAKEGRARDAALAMQEYEAKQRAVRANIARLRALRLGKEAANRQPTKTREPVKKDRQSRARAHDSHRHPHG
jgi:hypothetical protein